MNSEIERAFRLTCKIVLGKELKGMNEYEDWLTARTGSSPIRRKSGLSDATVYIPDIPFYAEIKKGIVTLEEVPGLENRKLDGKAVEKLTLTNAGKMLKEVKVFSLDAKVDSTFMEECSLYGWSHYCYRSVCMNKSKYCGNSFWPRQSDHVFGSRYLFSSAFSLKCYYSVNLMRCFEVLDCTNCADCYFCHNCETMENCMFCFNSKGLRYAIANVEVGREQYLRIKKIVLDEITDELEKTKKLGLSIYTIGSRGK